MTKNKILLTHLVCVVLSFGIGYVIGTTLTDSSYEKKFNSIRAYFPTPREDSPILYDAVVERIEGNIIFFSISSSTNPFDEWPINRRVLITEQTYILKRETKLALEYNKEVENFNKNPEGKDIPVPYTDRKIDLSEIKKGDRASIEAFKNIKMHSSFEAKTITFL